MNHITTLQRDVNSIQNAIDENRDGKNKQYQSVQSMEVDQSSMERAVKAMKVLDSEHKGLLRKLKNANDKLQKAKEDEGKRQATFA